MNKLHGFYNIGNESNQLWGLDTTFRGGNCQDCYLPSEKSSSLVEYLLPLLDGTWHAGKETGSHITSYLNTW